MLDAFGHLLRLPLSAMVLLLEGTATALRRLDRATARGWSEVTNRLEGEPRKGGGVAATAYDATPPAAGAPAAQTDKEDRRVADTNLSDDMVKLVRYSIVSIERDHLAKPVVGEYELFDENMDAQSFANWVTAKHSAKVAGHDNKYLRVSYEVLQRWPKQDREYERKQLEELRGIREAIEERN